jgi:hypothetical protein
MTGTDKHIELYVRSLLPDGAHGRLEAVIERLERLDAEDEVEDFSVIVWGKQVARDSAAAHTEEGRFILNRVAEFKQWALSSTVSLESFYQQGTVENETSAQSRETITLPVMGLAEYEDDELVHVAPCTRGETVHTIQDRLGRIERGEPATVDADTDVSIVSD